MLSSGVRISPCALLAPGVGEKLADFVAAGIEHRRCFAGGAFADRHFKPRRARRLGPRSLIQNRRRRLRPVLAERLDRAMPAFRPARLAHIAAMQDQPVMGVLLELVGDEFLQRRFDRAHVLAGRESGAIRDAKDMRIDGDGRMAERRVQDHVRRLAADARQRFERLAIVRHFAAVLVDAECGTSRSRSSPSSDTSPIVLM